MSRFKLLCVFYGKLLGRYAKLDVGMYRNPRSCDFYRRTTGKGLSWPNSHLALTPHCRLCNRTAWRILSCLKDDVTSMPIQLKWFHKFFLRTTDGFLRLNKIKYRDSQIQLKNGLCYNFPDPVSGFESVSASQTNNLFIFRMTCEYSWEDLLIETMT